MASFTVRGQEQPAPSLPTVDILTAGSDWQVEASPTPSGSGATFRQWLLRDSDANQALLYLGATARTQTMAQWSGELGYQGEGYVVTERAERSLRIDGGPKVTVATAIAQQFSDRRLIEYAVADPNGLTPRGTDSLVSRIWEAFRGRAGPYYLVRVSVVVTKGQAAAAQTADGLLAVVLPHVLAKARTA